MSGGVQKNAVIVTHWGDYEIKVWVGLRDELTLPHCITARYEILKFARLLAHGSIPTTYTTFSDGAESALRIAKLDARALLDGPFPSY